LIKRRVGKTILGGFFFASNQISRGRIVAMAKKRRVAFKKES